MAEREFEFTLAPAPEHLSPMAQSAIQLSTLSLRMPYVERTSVFHTNGRPENVAEHSFMLGVIAPAIAEEFRPDLDPLLMARFAVIHDLLEAYVGDTPTHIIDEAGLQAKEAREKAAFAQMRKDYAFVPTFVARMHDYEAQELPEARSTSLMDKWLPYLLHIHDQGAGLRRSNLDAVHLAQNMAEKRRLYAAKYPEPESIALIDVRDELIRYAGSFLEK